MMRVLIACEFSGIVRDAFAARGHDAWSCDILPTERPGQHIMDDVRNVLDCGWDLMIAHPPCTYLAASGVRWLYEQPDRVRLMREALDFVRALMYAPIPHIAIENPVSLISTYIRKPDQTIQPYEHGHGEMKTTCLWLKNLPRLYPTGIVSGRYQRVWLESPSEDRAKNRSRTYTGIAEAMAAQWGGQLPYQPNLIDHQQLIVRSTKSCYNSSIRITASAVVGSTAPAIITGKDTSE